MIYQCMIAEFPRSYKSDKSYKTSKRERPKSVLYLTVKMRKVFEIVKGGTIWASWKSRLLLNI